MTEGRALGLAGAAHLALLAGLSLAVVTPPLPLPPFSEATPVEVVDIGPTPTVTEPPKPSIEAAPQETVEAAAPPEPPAPAPSPPVPPEPAPADVSDAPPLDTVAPEPLPKATPKPAPPKPAPPRPRVERPAAAAKPAAKPMDAAALANLIDKALPRAPRRTERTDAFAKSIEKAIPRGARLDARAMATLQQAIRSQIAPCWNPPLGGADVATMTAVLRIRLREDGTVAARPEFVSQTGETAENAAYARAFVETAKRAVLRCAPIRLPAELFPYWQQFELNFDPREMT